MANLMDTFSDAATQEQPDGQNPVAPAFNKAATEAPAEKDAMTTDAAIQTAPSDPAIFETARMIVPRDDLSDEAFAAIRRGDAPRLKTLLDDGLDVNTRDEQGYTLLMRATQEGATEMARDLLIRQADPDARADAGLTALMLAATNGNVEIAQLLLDEIEDSEFDNGNDEVAEELALEHGNMAVYFAIEARKRRNTFNRAALDQNSEERETKKDCKERHESLFGTICSETKQYVAEETHTIVAAIGRGCHNVAAACSRFFHHQGATAAPDATATETTLASAAEPAKTAPASMLAKLLHLDMNNNNKA